MRLIHSGDVVNIFNLLNQGGLKYILVRNINNELPAGIAVGKDIDILVKKQDEGRFCAFFDKNGYEAISHPFKDNIFLYGVDRFLFKYNNNNNILFDLNFQLAVRSLDAGQWIPLDQLIQKSAWKNRRFEQGENGFSYWSLSYNDEFVCLVARSVFDKRKFEQGYIDRINELYQFVDRNDVMAKLNLIFFKFTPCLMRLISDCNYHDIVSEHLSFMEY